MNAGIILSLVKIQLVAIIAAALGMAPISALAQTVVASYAARIGPKDRLSIKGGNLTQPWLILQQDRANFHRFGISQPGDEWDPFFDSIKHRKHMQTMLRQGSISAEARKRLLNGGVVQVQVIKQDGQHILRVSAEK